MMMKEFGFVYDATVIAPANDKPYWPYTLDFKVPHECNGKSSICFCMFSYFSFKRIMRLFATVFRPNEVSLLERGGYNIWLITGADAV